MSVDLESQLAALGAVWNTTVTHVEPEEVVHDGGVALRDSTPRAGRDTRRGRGVLALCAALVLILIAVLTVFPRRDRPTPGIGVTTTIDSSVPTSVDGAGWAPTGQMVAMCAWCGAVLLADGRVLVTGGIDVDANEYVVQIYDPSTATFARVAGLDTPDQFTSAVELPDGRVLMAGDFGVVAVLDRTTNSVTVSEVRLQGTVVPIVLADGRAMLFDADGAYWFDATTGTITPAGRTTRPRSAGIRPVAVELSDGTVLVAGGATYAASETYDPSTQTFTPTGPTNALVGSFTATVLLDGRVLIAGGSDGAGSYPAQAEIYDPATRSFTTTGSMTQGRFEHTATRLTDGRVLIVGGNDGRFGVASTEIYDPASGTFTTVPGPSGRRIAASAVALPGNRVLVLGNYAGNGGMGSETDSSTAEIFSFGDPGLPSGCCQPNPSDVELSASLPTADGSMLAGVPLQVRIEVPPGGLRGAVRASYSRSAMGSDGQGGGDGGELRLPKDCDDGCQWVLPIDPTLSETSVSLDVKVIIAFEGSPPPESEQMTISIEPSSTATND